MIFALIQRENPAFPDANDDDDDDDEDTKRKRMKRRRRKEKQKQKKQKKKKQNDKEKQKKEKPFAFPLNLEMTKKILEEVYQEYATLLGDRTEPELIRLVLLLFFSVLNQKKKRKNSTMIMSLTRFFPFHLDSMPMVRGVIARNNKKVEALMQEHPGRHRSPLHFLKGYTLAPICKMTTRMMRVTPSSIGPIFGSTQAESRTVWEGIRFPPAGVVWYGDLIPE